MYKNLPDNSPTGFDTMTSSIEFADKYNNWLLEKFKKQIGKDLLEIGTGQANFKKYIKSVSNFTTYISIDVDKNVINRAKERDPDGVYLSGDISHKLFIQELKKYNYDTVIMVNVLEHIENDKEVLKNIYEILSKKGHLLLFVPAFNYLYNDMDRLAGHYRRYTIEYFNKLIKDLEFSIIKLEYFNPIGGIGWWVNKFRKHENLNSKNLNRQVLFFNKYIVPLSKIINPITKNFFGQSLIAILKKD